MPALASSPWPTSPADCSPSAVSTSPPSPPMSLPTACSTALTAPNRCATPRSWNPTATCLSPPPPSARSMRRTPLASAPRWSWKPSPTPSPRGRVHARLPRCHRHPGAARYRAPPALLVCRVAARPALLRARAGCRRIFHPPPASPISSSARNRPRHRTNFPSRRRRLLALENWPPSCASPSNHSRFGHRVHLRHNFCYIAAWLVHTSRGFFR